MDAFRLDGKVVILTGGGGFLGRRHAAHLAEAGARVAVVDVDLLAAEAAAAAAKGDGSGDAAAFSADVSSKDSVARMVSAVAARWGRVDGLVNNAAIDPKFDPGSAAANSSDFESLPLEVWNQALNVNITGAFLCAQAAAPHLLKSGKGVVVNISSIYGMVGPDQRLYERPDGARLVKPATYTVTKSALLGLTRYLSTYWAGKGIRVNTLTLGGVFAGHDEEFTRRYSQRTPLGRMALPDEPSGALRFLLSDASSYMTGANLVFDGGWTAW